MVRGIGRVNEAILVHDDTVKVAELTRFTAWTAPRKLESQILIEDLNAVVAHVADVEIATWATVSAIPPIRITRMRRNFTTIELLGLPSKKIGRFTRIHPDGSKAVRADRDLISPSSRTALSLPSFKTLSSSINERKTSVSI